MTPPRRNPDFMMWSSNGRPLWLFFLKECVYYNNTSEYASWTPIMESDGKIHVWSNGFWKEADVSVQDAYRVYIDQIAERELLGGK